MSNLQEEPSPRQRCSRCVMDTSAQGITFDDLGVCSYCTEFLFRTTRIRNESAEDKRLRLDMFVEQVKRKGQGKEYDCVVGVSGGVDSSWALVQAVAHGLRPLAVHMDNGWNSELAQSNIANLVRNLGVDLYTHVIDWIEYRTLMQAFFDADVIDVELLYDNAMLAVNYQQAAAHGVSHILAGTNQATEGMRMPSNWAWLKYDRRNIKSIGRRSGAPKLDTFPSIGTLGFIWYEFVRRIRWTSFLDFFDYNKAAAMSTLQQEYAYKPYPYKHYESVFTRFYQGYLLPEKFGVDKRLLHLGTLVASGQMTRDEALKGLEGIAFPSEDDLQSDREYFLKKMGWNRERLEEYLRRPRHSHADYGSERWLWDALSRFYVMAAGRNR